MLQVNQALLACLMILATSQNVRSEEPSEVTIIPQKRPVIEVDTPEDKVRKAIKKVEKVKALVPLTSKEIEICEAALTSMNVEFKIREPIVGKNGCGIARPYEVVSINGVTVKPATQLKCTTAQGFATWVTSSVVPAVAALSASNSENASVTLKSIRQASTYSCRRRNNRPEGKLSEHATGSGVDIGAFEFNNYPTLGIKPYEKVNSINAAFQKSVRSSACLYFTTVLGPGSDAYHDDHLHLDLAKRRKGSRYCR